MAKKTETSGPFALVRCSVDRQVGSDLNGDLKPDSRERLCSWHSFVEIMKLFVGNLSFDTSEKDLQDLFEQYGSVTEVRLVDDRMTGRSRGFAFVTFSNVAEGQAAITALDGKEVGGRNLKVNEARPKGDRPNRSFSKTRR